MNPSLNIVNVARRFVREEWGGTETVILETAKRLLDRGHQCEVLCPNALAGSNRETIDGLPVRRTPYFYPYLGLGPQAKHALDRKGGNLFSLALMRRLQELPKLDLLHTHTGKRLGGIVRHVAKQRNVPYVVSLHGGVHDVPKSESRTWTAPTRGTLEWGKVLGWWVGSRRVLDDAAAIICVGRREYELTQRRYPAKRVVHLPNGVDCERFANGDGHRFRSANGIPASAQLITVIGRIDVQKNQRLALEALGAMKDLRPNVHLALIGPVTNETYLNELEQLVNDLDIADRVTMIRGVDPHSPTLQDAYQASDVFLLPSSHEPFGIVVLEAWAAGTPVAASRVGGVASLVDHEVDGLLFESGNRHELTAAVGRILDDRSLSERLATRGREKAQTHYGWRSITDQLLQLYEEVLR